MLRASTKRRPRRGAADRTSGAPAQIEQNPITSQPSNRSLLSRSGSPPQSATDGRVSGISKGLFFFLLLVGQSVATRGAIGRRRLFAPPLLMGAFALVDVAHQFFFTDPVEIAEQSRNNPVSDPWQLPIALVIQALHLEDDIGDPVFSASPGDTNREKVAIMEKYRPYFRHLVYDTPAYLSSDRQGTCNDAVFHRVGAKCVQCNVTEGGTEDWADTHRYACAALAMEEFKDDAQVAGVAVMHTDFLLLPSFIKQARQMLDSVPDAFWLPQASTDSLRSPPNKDPASISTRGGERWHWPVYANIYDDSRREIAESLGIAGLAPDFGKNNVDFYYVPRVLWGRFSSFSPVLTKHGVLNEIAVQFMLRFGASLEGTTGANLGCGGSCCTELSKTLLRNPQAITCGHKINLGDNETRHILLAKAWPRPDIGGKPEWERL